MVGGGRREGGPSAAERGARARGARARRTLSDRERTPFAIQDDEALSPHLAEAGRVRQRNHWVAWPKVHLPDKRDETFFMKDRMEKKNHPKTHIPM